MKHEIPIAWEHGYGQVRLELGRPFMDSPTMVRIEISGGARHARWAYIPIDALLSFVSKEIQPYLRAIKQKKGAL